MIQGLVRQVLIILPKKSVWLSLFIKAGPQDSLNLQLKEIMSQLYNVNGVQYGYHYQWITNMSGDKTLVIDMYTNIYMC